MPTCYGTFSVSTTIPIFKNISRRLCCSRWRVSTSRRRFEALSCRTVPDWGKVQYRDVQPFHVKTTFTCFLSMNLCFHLAARLSFRGGHRHLQIGRTLDIDLISEHPLPDVCLQSVGICVARRGRKRFIASLAPHAPPPPPGHRSKVESRHFAHLCLSFFAS